MLAGQALEMSGMLILAMPGIVLATGFFLLLNNTIGLPRDLLARSFSQCVNGDPLWAESAGKPDARYHRSLQHVMSVAGH